LSAPTAMPVKVVDASDLAALLFGEPEAESVAGRLGDDRLVAPALLRFELANVCLVKLQLHPEQRQALTAAFRLRHRLAVDEVAVDHDGALELAAAIGLTPYEASYLWLARELGADLVTLDQRLAKADASSRR
jgi:predicted nucleic acid-binding protein